MRIHHSTVIFWFPILLCAQLFGELRTIDSFTPSLETTKVLGLHSASFAPSMLERAVLVLEHEATSGDPVAHYQLGLMIVHARGTILDYARAEHHFKVAIEHGIAEAWTSLGELYASGRAHPVDLDYASICFRKAAHIDHKARLWLEGKSPIQLENQQAAETNRFLELNAAAGNLKTLYDKGYQHSYKSTDSNSNFRVTEEALGIGNIHARTPKHFADSYRYPVDRERRKRIKQAIREIVYTYQSYGIEAGIQKLEDKARVEIRTSLDYHPFRHALFNEAFRGTGRDDQDWAQQVWKQLITLHQKWSDKLPTVLVNNLIAVETELGLLGELRIHQHSLLEGYIKDYGLVIDVANNPHLHRFKPRLPAADIADAIPSTYPETGNLVHDRLHAHQPLSWPVAWGISALSSSERAMGDWRAHFGYTLSLLKYLDEATRNQAYEDSRYSRSNLDELKLSTRMDLGRCYSLLGFHQKALAEYRKVVSGGRNVDYVDRQIMVAQRAITKLESKYGLPLSYDLETLYRNRRQTENNRTTNYESRFDADIAIIRRLRYEGRYSDAQAVVNDLLSNEDLSIRARIDVITNNISWSLDDGKTDGVEEALLLALRLNRERGRKANEPSLYHSYSRLKALQGDYKSAIDLQLQYIDLCRALDLYTWIPYGYSVLAQLYYESSATDQAMYYANLAKKIRDTPGAQYPEYIRRKTQEIYQLVAIPSDSSKIAMEEHKAPPRVLLEPNVVVSAPLIGQSSMAIFSLSNQTNKNQSVVLSTSGQKTNIREEPTSGSILIDLGIASGENQIQLTLKPEEQRFISIQSDIEKPHRLQMKLTQTNSSSQQAEFRVSGATGNRIAITNAALVEQNPFYASSIFHVIQRGKDAPHTVNLRFSASDSLRIECYDHNGNLIFVDTDGDGNFTSPGDLLRLDQDADGNPDITFDDNTTSHLVEIRLSAQESGLKNEILIEAAHLEHGKWIVDAENVLSVQ